MIMYPLYETVFLVSNIELKDLNSMVIFDFYSTEATNWMFSSYINSDGMSSHQVYTDGVERWSISHIGNFLTSYVPVTTRVIAIEVNHRKVYSYLIGSLSDNHTVTDASWKCIELQTWTSDDSWKTASYDDTSVSFH